MKLLIVSATNQRRGAEIEAFELGCGLRESGIGVSHVSLSSSDRNDDLLPIETLGKRWLSPLTLIRLRRHAQESDVILAFGSTALPACVIALLGTHKSFIFRSIGDVQHWLRGRIHRWRTGVLMRRPQRIVCLWQDDADSMVKLLFVSAENISIIPNARHIEDFPLVTDLARVEARKLLGFTDSDRIVAVVGSLSEEKRIELAIETIMSDSTLKLVVAGDGPLRVQLEKLAEIRAPGRVTFLGRLEEVVRIYALADVVLITSQTEGLPGVVIEAGFCGVPVVATNVGGLMSISEICSSICVVGGNNANELLAQTQVAIKIDLHTRQETRELLKERFDWSAVLRNWQDLLVAVSRNQY